MPDLDKRHYREVVTPDRSTGQSDFMWIIQAEPFGARKPMRSDDAAKAVAAIINGWKNLDTTVITVERVKVETTHRIIRRHCDYCDGTPDARRRPQWNACDRCHQPGPNDSLNPHSRGECECECHQ